MRKKRSSWPKHKKVPWRDDEALGPKTPFDMPPLWNRLFQKEKKARKK